MLKRVILIALLVINAHAFGDWLNDQKPGKWNQIARDRIDQMLKKKINRNVAKNVILFLGDGMGISTVTAGRILKGQLQNRSGEEEITFMESMDHSAFSKTYNIDAQTPDSAGTATAYLSGVKSRFGVIGVDGNAVFGDCKSSLNAKLDSILQWAHKVGKSVGIVTTTRITHATPSAAYANSPNRDWEVYDDKVFGDKEFNEGCRDIASQLIDDHSYINVIFGGGRRFFLPNSMQDYKENATGVRTDKRNLIGDWIQKMEKDKKSYKFIWDPLEFKNLDAKKYDHVLALMGFNHMEFDYYRQATNQPSLAEMTEKAIQLLEKNEKGYFLLVEGGRIDHGHHDGNAFTALHDFVAFDNAIGKGLSMTSEQDTLTVVTADHSHTLTIGGYSSRGNNIFGLVYSPYRNLSDTNLTFTSLTYANGPNGLRRIRTRNFTDAEVEHPKYLQEAVVYIKSETHGGEDVPIYASGPMSYLLSGTVEQHFIAHAMAYSMCIGKYNRPTCLWQRGYSHATKPSTNLVTYFTFLLLFVYFLQ